MEKERGIKITKLNKKKSSICGIICKFYFFLVKWLVLKPLIKMNHIINGKIIGDVKWYQRRFTMPVKSKWLNSVTYKLTKYLVFHETYL